MTRPRSSVVPCCADADMAMSKVIKQTTAKTHCFIVTCLLSLPPRKTPYSNSKASMRGVHHTIHPNPTKLIRKTEADREGFLDLLGLFERRRRNLSDLPGHEAVRAFELSKRDAAWYS